MKSLRILTLLLALPLLSNAQNQADRKNFGTYKVENAPFNTILVYEEDGKVVGEAVNAGKSELMANGDADTYDLAEVPGGKVEFVKNDKGITESLILNMNGEQVTGTRQLSDFAEYNGIYEMDSDMLSEVKVDGKDGVLKISTVEFGSGELSFTGIIDQFLENSYGSDFIFVRNEEGEVISLNIELASQGIYMKGMKKVAKPTMELYIGRFEFQDAPLTLKTEIRDGKLYGITEQGEAFLTPSELEHLFDIEGVDGTVLFEVNENGEVTEVTLTYQGQPMLAYPAK